MSETVRPGGRPVDEQTLGELVATMSRDLSVLVHKEIELGKAEITADIKRAGLGAGALGGGGFFAYVGLLFASVTAAFGIHALGLGLGWSFLIVTGAYFALAGLLALVGIKSVTKVGPPRRTIATVKGDLAWARHPRRDPGNGSR
jgi:Putative Actinobacterial Holin-X, holin superfamily III